MAFTNVMTLIIAIIILVFLCFLCGGVVFANFLWKCIMETVLFLWTFTLQTLVDLIVLILRTLWNSRVWHEVQVRALWNKYFPQLFEEETPRLDETREIETTARRHEPESADPPLGISTTQPICAGFTRKGKRFRRNVSFENLQGQEHP